MISTDENDLIRLDLRGFKVKYDGVDGVAWIGQPKKFLLRRLHDVKRGWVWSVNHTPICDAAKEAILFAELRDATAYIRDELTGYR